MRRTCWVNLTLLFYFRFPLRFSKLHCENSNLAQPCFPERGQKGTFSDGSRGISWQTSKTHPGQREAQWGKHTQEELSSQRNSPRRGTIYSSPQASAVHVGRASTAQRWAALGPLSRPEGTLRINGQVCSTGSLSLGTVASRLAGQKLWGVLLSPTRPHLTTDALDAQMYTGTPRFMWFWGPKLRFSWYAASSLLPEPSIFKYWAIFIVNVSGYILDTGI